MEDEQKPERRARTKAYGDHPVPLNGDGSPGLRLEGMRVAELEAVLGVTGRLYVTAREPDGARSVSLSPEQARELLDWLVLNTA